MINGRTVIESSVAYYVYYNGETGTCTLMKYDLEKQRCDKIKKLSSKAQ
ncbi:MAG: hypothetical protein ACI36Y_03795 [Coriobacteriales bacterium]